MSRDLCTNVSLLSSLLHDVTDPQREQPLLLTQFHCCLGVREESPFRLHQHKYLALDIFMLTIRHRRWRLFLFVLQHTGILFVFWGIRLYSRCRCRLFNYVLITFSITDGFFNISSHITFHFITITVIRRINGKPTIRWINFRYISIKNFVLWFEICLGNYFLFRPTHSLIACKF